WVFGTELPRLAVNEVLAQSQENDPDEAYSDTVRLFVELHNPFPRAVPADVYQPDSFPVPLRLGAGAAAYTPYRLLFGVKSAVFDRANGAAVLPGFDNDNVLGNPEFAVVRQATTTDDFLTAATQIDGNPQPPWPGATGYDALPAPYVP